MADYLLADAARVLGVSIDTVKRRMRRGELAASKDPRGRWCVHLTDPVPGHVPLHAHADTELLGHDRGSAPADAWADAVAGRTIPLPHDGAATGAAHGTPLPDQLSPDAGRLALELAHAQELLAEVRRHRDELAAQLESQRAQLQAAHETIQQDAVERAELRRLLASTQQQVARLLPAPVETGPDGGTREGAPGAPADGRHPPTGVRRRWWQRWRRPVDGT